ncbi:MAG: hypothetical protein JW987_00570 [Anaerolineaceae bacterium]|nr:hypothetical protein [Anaerolineaceae bacterium]
MNWEFDGQDSVEVEIHMLFACSECQEALAEYSGTSTEEVPKLAEYLDEHEDADASEGKLSAPEVETKIITRAGVKTYLAKWKADFKLGRKTFKVNGEVAANQATMEKMS